MADTVVEKKDEQKTNKPLPPVTRRLRMRRSRTGFLLWGVLLIALAAGGYFLWTYLSSYESTDDAQIDGHVDAISARINGHVSVVLVEDAQVVKAGDALVKIDPRDYQVAVAQAEANLADAEASSRSSHTNIPIVSTNTQSTLDTARASRVNAVAGLTAAQRQMEAAQAALETAQAQVLQAQAIHKKDTEDAERYRLLVAKDEFPRQTYDQTVQTVAADKAAVDARIASVNQARHNVAAAQAAVAEAQSKIPQADAFIQSANTRPSQMVQSQENARSAEARVKQQQAAVDQAKLNLSYTIIPAPYDGIVGKKTVEIGENVSPGQSLMSVVPLDDIWVTANFKETQLKKMRPGQKVVFSVDAYGREYHAHITGVGGATGSRFSLIPPENATGNYVKVVQRIPVRIDLDPGENKDHLLRVGMSVAPKVYLNK
jgi:membrane fusion protein, multidrug efflux system